MKNVRPLPTSEALTTAYELTGLGSGSGALKPSHKGWLNEAVVEVLRTNEAHGVRLVGRGGRPSRERVAAVARYLAKAGVARARMRREIVSEPGGGAAVEVHVWIAPTLTLMLDAGFLVRPTPVLVGTIWDALAPVARQAGRELKVELPFPGRVSELTLRFQPGGQSSDPCAGDPALSSEGRGRIYVGAHEDLRVCGDSAPLERVFQNGETEFARFVGNTAVHELGHVVARLRHTSDPFNVMYCAPLFRDQRTRERLRRHWSGRRTFNAEQSRRLAEVIATARYSRR